MWSIPNAEAFFKPAHSSSLAVTRILFGMLMLFDIPEERGGAIIDIRWGDAKYCNFPLFSFLPRPTYPWMCLLYGVMYLGALGIWLGYKYRLSCSAFIIPYWYILLLDKTFWNNHSYLYGLLAILLSVTQAGNHWSLDALMGQEPKKQDGVPFWNYFILRFQLFCLYFFAGLKKMNMEWLEGYAMANLGEHWVFHPFGLLLTTEQIDFLVIHLTGFLLDLTIGFFLLEKRSRPIALVFCGMFHFMNSRLFSIGLFPYVCIATMPIFCEPNWPVNLYNSFINLISKIYNQTNKPLTTNHKEKIKKDIIKETKKTKNKTVSKSNKFTIFLITVYCFVQIFLPWSHFITKGYNNWTNGMYGYSWDMMVHSWDTTLVVVRVVDNNSEEEVFLDPSAWVHNDRWNKHGDMTIQYAQCVKNNAIQSKAVSENISIYLDVWCSLNGRFQQRMFDPRYDLLKANWSPFQDVEWLLPVLYEYSDFREKMKLIQKEVYSWSNYSDVLFVADFPGLYMENFISEELRNISLTIIEGMVLLEMEGRAQSVILKQGDHMPLIANVFHKVTTLSKSPSCYMYTYENRTKVDLHETNSQRAGRAQSPFPVLEGGMETVDSLTTMCGLIGNALLHVLYDVPMMRRARVE